MEVILTGEVVSNDIAEIYRYFGMDGFICPQDVTDAISRNPDGETLTLFIDSVGGSVFAGYSMYCELKKAICETVAVVHPLAASAASLFICGANTVLISPVGQVMIHLPRTVAWGTEKIMEETAQMLKSNTESFLNAYELRCKGKTTREELRALTEAETWLHPQKAIEVGFADDYYGVDTPVFSADMVAAVQPIIQNRTCQRGSLNFDAMRTAYEAHLLSTQQAAANEDFSAKNHKALLAIEKLRFGGNL